MIDWLLAKICGETLPADDIIHWLFATYGWLIEHEGGVDAFRKNRPLILPTQENFPIHATATDGHPLALEVFDYVRQHAHMSSWPCELIQQELEPEMTGRQAIGTYKRHENGQVRITYRQDLLSDVPTLISVLAHELGHYYLSHVKAGQPGGPKAREYATDVAVTFLGFGIFKANCVYRPNFRIGYLGELPSAYSLAIFTELHRLDPGFVIPHLRPNPASYYKECLRDLRKTTRRPALLK